MKSVVGFQLVIVFLDVLIFVRSQSETTCIRGEDAKKLNDRFVREHNEFRSRHGVPPLEADSSLVEDSIKWSEQMTNSGVMEHSQGDGYGENIYMSTRPAPIVESEIDAVQRWYDEIKLYTSPHFTMETGHFTQVVWKSSRKVGCGVCAGAAGTYLTCRYTPAGNYANEFAENVPPVKENAITDSAGPTYTSSTTRNDIFLDTTTESYTKYTGQPIDPDMRSTIEPTEQSDTFSKVLKIVWCLISLVVIVVSLVPVVLLSSMIYKSTSGHRPINQS